MYKWKFSGWSRESISFSCLVNAPGNDHSASRLYQQRYRNRRRTALRILHSQRYHPYDLTLTPHTWQSTKTLELLSMGTRPILTRSICFWSVMFSNKATFNSNGKLNRHNNQYWSDRNPNWHRLIYNKNRWSLTRYLIGPYFSKETSMEKEFLLFWGTSYLNYLIMFIHKQESKCGFRWKLLQHTGTDEFDNIRTSTIILIGLAFMNR